MMVSKPVEVVFLFLALSSSSFTCTCRAFTSSSTATSSTRNNAFAFQATPSSYVYSPYTSHSHLMMTTTNNDEEKNEEKNDNTTNNRSVKISNSHSNAMISRRGAFTKATTAAAATTTTLLTTTGNNANAFTIDDINPFSPLDRKTTNNYQFKPAKRPTSYLVDSTIPPTLVSFQAQREAAILKTIGGGYGTSKTPFIEEKLTLNNMMNKGVFGTIDFFKGVTGNENEEEEEENFKDEKGKGKSGQGGVNTSSSSSKKNKKGYEASFVFLGLDYNNDTGEDVQLAIDLIADIIKPRRGLDTAISLSFVPISLQKALNEYMTSTGTTSNSDVDAEKTIIQALRTDGQVPQSIIQNQMPLLQYAKSKQIKLIASSPDPTDVQTVRSQGLQNIDPERRSQYVADSQGFIDWTQEPKNKLYTERSLLKDWIPLDEKERTEIGPSGFFAEKILVHEAIATRMANYAFLNTNSSSNTKKNAMVINVSSIADVRFLGGPNGRIARICKVIRPETSVDEEAVTTILINPSAKETLSQSKFLRLEIGTAPRNLAYQTKVADYLWFSSIPKVNMIPRLMNG